METKRSCGFAAVADRRSTSLLDASRLRLLCCAALVALCIVNNAVNSQAWAETPNADKTRTAIDKSLALIAASAATYIDKRGCFSCHHQALPVMTLSLAQTRGFTVDPTVTQQQSVFTKTYFTARVAEMRQGKGVPGGAYAAGYALISLFADRQHADETTDALLDFLIHRQQDDGRWRIQTHRPPLEDSDFTATALAIRSLRQWSTPDREEELTWHIARALEWLRTARPISLEDRAFHLFGLHWAQALSRDIDAAAEQLWALQQSDGGWSQLPEMKEMKSDSYATGQALVALQEAGAIAAMHEAYRRGIDFLLRTQQDDGSWLVDTRSKPIQVYFESGFPHGKSQFISISGTCWATMALIQTMAQ